MRIWSLHPSYLDTKGLLAVWRETLLAKNVLEGKTKGYKNHPQLLRFKSLENPVKAINTYLQYIYDESIKRGYTFDKSKIGDIDMGIQISVTKGQIEFEYQHLLKKLEVRDPKRYLKLSKEKNVRTHPLFCIMDGAIESWEKI